jgi:hypothetical protein
MSHPRDHEQAEMLVDVDVRVGLRPAIHLAVPSDLRNTENQYQSDSRANCAHTLGGVDLLIIPSRILYYLSPSTKKRCQIWVVYLYIMSGSETQ